MHSRIEHGGPNPPLLQRGSAGQPGDAAADDGDIGIPRRRGGEDDLLLRQGLLDDGPPRGPVRAPPRALAPPPAAVAGLRGAAAAAGEHGFWSPDRGGFDGLEEEGRAP